MKLPSIMQHQFSNVPKVDIPRSAFDRSHGLKTTFDAGYIVPVLVDEALPGDTINIAPTFVARLATPIFPVMDNVFLDWFLFACPYRLLWTSWAKFNGAQANPGDSTSYTVPQIVSPASGWAVNSLQDYLGWPTVGQVGAGNTVSQSAFYTRAYNLIWNEWFRDQNLQNSVTVDTGDAADTAANYVLLKRGKRHDYFTSCLPWPQKGTAVTLPLGTTAEVWGNSAVPTALGNNNAAPIVSWFGDRVTTDGAFQGSLAGAQRTGVAPDTVTTVAGGAGAIQQVSLGFRNGTQAGVGNVNTDVASDAVFLNKAASQTFRATATAPWVADLSGASSATINQLRQSFQIQKIYERDARGGTRYTEIVLAHFNVKSPDGRLQRPEFLGGGSERINFSAVPKTSSSDGTSPQGNLAAFAVGIHHGKRIVHSFTEHCVLLMFVSVRADVTYQQGLERQFSRSTRWDFYWPELAQIGEQAVLNKEIFADGSANDALTFGYQERYAEYRYKPSRITGKFKSTSAANIDEWHLSQQFGALPTLNDTFIKETPPMSRVLAATGYTNDVLMDAYFDWRHVRPMPVFGVPGLIDHF